VDQLGTLLTSAAGRTKPTKCIGGRWRRSPDPVLLFNQGVLLEDLGKSTAALAAYRRHLQRIRSGGLSLTNLARLYEALGKRSTPSAPGSIPAPLSSDSR